MKSPLITLHLSGLPPRAIRTVKAAVAYAEKHKARREQNMPFHEFYTMAGLPTTTTRAELVSLMSRTRRAIASIRIIDDTEQKKELLAGSWPVFEGNFITNTHISFQICPYMWQDLTAAT
jgi:hypothetical protein